MNAQKYLIVATCLCVTLACNLQTTLSPATLSPSTPTSVALSSPTIGITPTSPIVATLVHPATATLEPTPLPITPANYAVVLVKEGDVLNVRSGAGVQYPILDTLPPQATNLHLGMGKQQVGESLWVEIILPNGGTGWVNAFYLTEEVELSRFCADERVKHLIADFAKAVRERDGRALAQLISPIHGLMIRHEWWNSEISFRTTEVTSLFDDTTIHDWGIADGSGLPIQGSFQEVILPRLLEVLEAEYSMHCNTLETNIATGSTTGLAILPYEYTNFRYYALYRPAPQDVEMDWRTWAVGIEYVRGSPTIVFLVQYHWEI